MDENGPYREAYRLERIVRGAASIIVTFYSAKEALKIIPSLNDNYRLMQGDRQIWPSKGSSGRHR
ncbi:MAG: hypothetical protein EOS76_22720 [Mesorhizobium sp.]|uniref:hypothetical protein n=1 Tax=Mesorhizobium sp. TaxID=1871066 RepID=UPI000FE7F880|nr:hypothetical protein [Mesorhizobium sp.]RWE15556.1 MAG: hypothetical protein EOS76_22720 [Mesorhizobium sp.]